MANNYYPFINLPLPYAYDALEPYIDEKTMQLHHDKHLQTYIIHLNETLQDHPTLQKFSLEELIFNAARLPRQLQTAVRNNAGGVFNHRFFFQGLTNPAEERPSEDLAQAINDRFGSFEEFRNAFKEAALSVFGSGYAWLVLGRGGLQIVTTANQDTPIEQRFCPILNIDVWEHAYYLKHYNVRADYIDDWFRIVNWSQAEENFANCLRGRRYC